jgi:hypothetical protein
VAGLQYRIAVISTPELVFFVVVRHGVLSAQPLYLLLSPAYHEGSKKVYQDV